jgi:hypothetical protein
MNGQPHRAVLSSPVMVCSNAMPFSSARARTCSARRILIEILGGFRTDLQVRRAVHDAFSHSGQETLALPRSSLPAR